jgi:hypothetical protein
MWWVKEKFTCGDTPTSELSNILDERSEEKMFEPRSEAKWRTTKRDEGYGMVNFSCPPRHLHEDHD